MKMAGEGSPQSQGNADHKRPLLTRIWQAIEVWEDAMNSTPHDYVLARLAAVENEIASLRADLQDRKARTRNAVN